MGWLSLLIGPVLAVVLGVWGQYPDDVRGRLRVGSLSFGYPTRIPCRFWTDDGPWPHPRRPVAGHLVIGPRTAGAPGRTLEFRSRCGRLVAPPADLVFAEARPSELPRLHHGRQRHTLRYRNPAGETFLFDVTAAEETALRAGLDLTLEVAGSLALRRSHRHVLPPATLAAAVLAAAGVVVGTVLSDRILLVLSLAFLIPALALAAFYVLWERCRWPLEPA